MSAKGEFALPDPPLAAGFAGPLGWAHLFDPFNYLRTARTIMSAHPLQAPDAFSVTYPKPFTILRGEGQYEMTDRGVRPGRLTRNNNCLV